MAGAVADGYRRRDQEQGAPDRRPLNHMSAGALSSSLGRTGHGQIDNQRRRRHRQRRTGNRAEGPYITDKDDGSNSPANETVNDKLPAGVKNKKRLKRKPDEKRGEQPGDASADPLRAELHLAAGDDRVRADATGERRRRRRRRRSAASLRRA